MDGILSFSGGKDAISILGGGVMSGLRETMGVAFVVSTTLVSRANFSVGPVVSGALGRGEVGTIVFLEGNAAISTLGGGVTTSDR